MYNNLVIMSVVACDLPMARMLQGARCMPCANAADCHLVAYEWCANEV